MGDIFIPGTAIPQHVLAGDIYSSGTNYDSQGQMINQGAITLTPSGTGTVAIPAGYHNGSGYIAQVAVPAANVLTGTTIAGVQGQMVNNGAYNITPTTFNKTIPQGYHNGSGYVVGDSNLVSGNIKSGVSIFGVAGNSNVIDTSGGSAPNTGYLLSGETYFSQGTTIAGAMPNYSGTNELLTWRNNNQDTGVTIEVPQGYWDGSSFPYVSDGNLVPSNIISGVSIFGIAGSYVGEKFASGSGTVATNTDTVYYGYAGANYLSTAGGFNSLTVSGLAFTPSLVIVEYPDSNGYLTAGTHVLSTKFYRTANSTASTASTWTPSGSTILYYGWECYPGANSDYDGMWIQSQMQTNGFKIYTEAGGQSVNWYAFA